MVSAPGPRGGGAAGAAAVAVFLLIALGPACGPGEGEAKRVILFIGDGMSAQTEVAASRYLHGTDDGLAWQGIAARAYVATWDVNVYNAQARLAGERPYSPSSFKPVLGYDARADGRAPRAGPGVARRFPPGPATDSASAATAMATGFKTDSGNIAWLPGDPPEGGLTTVAEELRDRRGASIGVVTTVPFDHATPAAFVSHNASRNSYYTGLKGYHGLGIADEIILRTRPEVVVGGGHPLLDNPGFDPKKGYISEALYRTLQASPEYVFVERRSGRDGGRALADATAEAAASGRKLFGLFGGKGGNFEVPVAEDSPGSPRVVRPTAENPTLAQATVAALELLARDPDGFFLVVEQGDIDWANHDNDFRGAVGAVADLDEAVRAALAFVERPGDAVDWSDTVLVVTADHATGGLLLDPARPLGRGDLPLQQARLAEEEAAPRHGPDRGTANGAAIKAAARLSPFLYPDGEVSYGTIGHTNELVDLYVRGAGARAVMRARGKWYPGLIMDNTQVNAALRRALGLGRAGRRG